MKRFGLFGAIAAIVLGVGLLNSFFIVDQRQQALLL